MNLKLVGGLVAVLAVGCALAVSAPSPANAKPEYAASTGKACATCHQNPTGGGPLKAYGEAFKANGYKLPAKK